MVDFTPKIMGILNVTPDSFSDGGHYFNPLKAVEHGLHLISQGADIIDVGGESTRPGARAVSLEEEWARVIPVIEQLAKESPIPISIDTRHPPIMEAAIKAGARFINDVSALTAPGALMLAARLQVPVCLMHMQGEPQTMQQGPHYHTVLKDIYDFFSERIQACEQQGIARHHIWLDPGFGFGKNLQHNLQLLANLTYFAPLGCALLVGLSRKSMFGQLINKPPQERLAASLAGAVVATLQGASLIRTHDVGATKEALAVVSALGPYWQVGEAGSNG